MPGSIDGPFTDGLKCKDFCELGWVFRISVFSENFFNALVFLHLFPHLGAPTRFLIKSWAFWVSASRVMLGRHYLTDVTCGALLSYGIYLSMTNGLFLSEAVCLNLFKILRSIK